MNRIIFSALSVAVINFIPLITKSQCNFKHYVEVSKGELDYYEHRYSGKGINYFKVKKESYTVENNFSAFPLNSYKLMFYVSDAIKDGLVIKIFDRAKNMARRKLLYNSKETGISNAVTGIGSDLDSYFTFDLNKAGNYFIEYEIPGMSELPLDNACVVLIIGFKSKAKEAAGY